MHSGRAFESSRPVLLCMVFGKRCFLIIIDRVSELGWLCGRETKRFQSRAHSSVVELCASSYLENARSRVRAKTLEAILVVFGRWLFLIGCACV